MPTPARRDRPRRPGPSASRPVASSSVNVLVAQSRIQDTEYLQRKENAFFALFRNPPEIQRTSSRISKAQWGELNPHFVSKLLVTSGFQPFCILLTLDQVDPPPVILTEDGQIQNEEDRPVYGSVRVWRTFRLFKDEALLISIGFVLQFIAIAASMYSPQLTKVFSEAQCVERLHPQSTRTRARTTTRI